MHRGDHLCADPFAAGSEQTTAGAAHLHDEVVAVAEQEEQRQQCEAEQHDAMQYHRANLASPAEQVALADALQQGRCIVGINEIGRPPFPGLRADQRHAGKKIGRRNAVLARLVDPDEDAVRVAAQRHRDHDQRQQEHQRDAEGEQRGHQHVMAPWRKARAGVAIKRPERDGEDAGPDECRQEFVQRPQAEH